MKRKRLNRKERYPFFYQVILIPILFILLLFGSIGVIYSNNQSYSYTKQDETSQNIANTINSTFQTINMSIATFFANETFQTVADEYLAGEPVYAEISSHLEFFINSNSMFSPGIVYIPCDDATTMVDKERAIAIDIEHSLIDFNYEKMMRSANDRLSGRVGTIFFQEITYGQLEDDTPYFALGKNVVSTISTSPSFYQRIGLVYVILHKSIMSNFLTPVSQINGMDAIIYDDEAVVFSSFNGANLAFLSDQRYRHQTSNLSINDWKLDVMFNKGQVLANIGHTAIIMSAISLLTLFVYLLIFIRAQKRYQKSLNYLFESFSDIKQSDSQSLIITKTGNNDIDNVIDSYNNMVNNVILLNEQVIEEQNKALTLKVENINYSLISLYSQINKHFIINVLAIIRSLVTLEEYKKVGPVIENFSAFLRYSLTLEKYTTFQEEVKNAENYLKIQAIRFPMFSAIYQMDHTLDKVKLPKIVLQPIIENCFVHGLQNAKCNIVISTYRNDQYAVLAVTNDSDENVDRSKIAEVNQQLQTIDERGVKQIQNPSKSSNNNLALINILKRLKIDDARSRMTIELDENGRTVVSIFIPLKGDQNDAKSIPSR